MQNENPPNEITLSKEIKPKKGIFKKIYLSLKYISLGILFTSGSYFLASTLDRNLIAKDLYLQQESELVEERNLLKVILMNEYSLNDSLTKDELYEIGASLQNFYAFVKDTPLMKNDSFDNKFKNYLKWHVLHENFVQDTPLLKENSFLEVSDFEEISYNLTKNYPIWRDFSLKSEFFYKFNAFSGIFACQTPFNSKSCLVKILNYQRDLLRHVYGEDYLALQEVFYPFGEDISKMVSWKRCYLSKESYFGEVCYDFSSVTHLQNPKLRLD